MRTNHRPDDPRQNFSQYSEAQNPSTNDQELDKIYRSTDSAVPKNCKMLGQVYLAGREREIDRQIDS